MRLRRLIGVLITFSLFAGIANASFLDDEAGISAYTKANTEINLNNSIAFVDIRDNFFDNSNITVPINTEVTWINFGNAVHTVTADDGSFNSGNLNKDQSFSRTFNVTGVYKYHCSIHPSMTGTVIVISESKGDLNNNGIPADAGDLVLMKRASIGEIQADSRYDMNNNGQPADAGDLVLMKRASIGEIKL